MTRGECKDIKKCHTLIFKNNNKEIKTNNMLAEILLVAQHMFNDQILLLYASQAI